MNFKTIQNKNIYKKLEPYCRNKNHVCNCHCHSRIRNNKTPNHLLLLEENANYNKNSKDKLNVIKTEMNTNIIKSFVIYKNQIKPLFFSKVVKNSRKNVSNLKKYSYGGNKLRIATNTNNHSYKEIIGRSSSKDKIFKKSRIINYKAENTEYNFDYKCNNNIKRENNNIIKNIKINNDRINQCSSLKNLSAKTDHIDSCKKDNKYNKYDVFLNDLNYKLNNFSKENYFTRNETGNNSKIKNLYNNIMFQNNFKYFYDYKKNLLEKKRNLLKSNSNSYMKITKNYPVNRVNENYEDLKLKIKLILMRKCKYNEEHNKNKMDIQYILLEKTKKILDEKNKRRMKKELDKINKINDNDKDNKDNTLLELKNLLENSKNISNNNKDNNNCSNDKN